MNISYSNLALVRSVLEDCGKYIEELSLKSEDFNENTFLENLLSDIDRSIKILKDKEQLYGREKI